MMRFLRYIAVIFLVTCLSKGAWASADFSRIDALIGPDDAVILMADNGTCLYAKHADKQLIPASTLKVLTSLSAFDALGHDFRFKTEFYLDSQQNLTIKGYGDPLLISEVITQCCDALYPALLSTLSISGQINDIRFDDSYFDSITVPGVTNRSPEPYDSPNGALCANFNTVSFYTDTKGKLHSAESQTPLLPFVISRIRATGLSKGRILLDDRESRIYAAELFRYFLEQRGLVVKGRIRRGIADASDQQLVYCFTSPYSIHDVVAKLLEYSNNFIANQLFLRTGAGVFGAPATLSKAIRVMNRYIASTLKLTDVTVLEGSGISRMNSISARNMDTVLKAFKPYRHLMKKSKNNVFYKTGTLNGISTRVGYIESPSKGPYRFVVFMNTPGKSSERIVRMLGKELK